MEGLRIPILIIATVAVGMFAGVFAIYTNAIMPGLRRTDDRTFVGAFQAIDTAVINPVFLLTFFGGLVLTGTAGLLHLDEGLRTALPWVASAFLLYLLVVVITLVVNVPLNDGIKAAGNPEQIEDLGAVRSRFNEAKWVRWNLIRVVLTTGAFGLLVWSLVLSGGLG